MAREYRQAGEERYQDALEDTTGYLAGLRRLASGRDLAAHLVPESTFWPMREICILGQVRLRHDLNDVLSVEGGHIGYDVRPSERRKGYGTAMLGLALEKARAIGLTRVMLTCDADNIASSRIIERNGGKLTGTATSPRTGKHIRQYWIEL
jgi:predicted acetyltransferase